MKILLVDPNSHSRCEVESELRTIGLEVQSFRDGTLAFLFLLSRLEAIDGVAINVDDAPPLLERLDSLNGLGVELAVVTYSGRDRSLRAEISALLSPAARAARAAEHPVAETRIAPARMAR